MKFYKMTETHAYCSCTCGEQLIFEIDKMKLDAASIILGKCKDCNRFSGIILAGEAGLGGSNEQQHVLNQTLAMRLFKRGKMENGCSIEQYDTNVFAIGKKWVEGSVLAVG